MGEARSGNDSAGLKVAGTSYYSMYWYAIVGTHEMINWRQMVSITSRKRDKSLQEVVGNVRASFDGVPCLA